MAHLDPPLTHAPEIIFECIVTLMTTTYGLFRRTARVACPEWTWQLNAVNEMTCTRTHLYRWEYM